ncbi:MAG: hypothetical protein WBA91_04800 [Paracoccaceae bacterium]
MTDDLPTYYFRVRENGALAFRIEPQSQLRRIEMDQIAIINIRNGEIKPHGDRGLSDEDMAAITDWMGRRTEELARREIDDIRRTIDQLNLTAHWAQSKASDADLEALTDDLLMAMHDLRSVLVRRKSDRLSRG